MAGLPAVVWANERVLFTSVDEWRHNRQEIREIEDARRKEAAWQLQQRLPTNLDERNQSEHQAGIEAALKDCLPDQRVELQGVHLLDAKLFHLPDCVNEDTLNLLSREITQAYIKAGFAGTRIDFEPKGDRLVVKVTEAKIRTITGGNKTVNIDMLFPQYKGKPLDIRYLDQGIEQANKLGANRLSMDIYPHDDGTATVELKNEAGSRASGQITVDNKGSAPYNTGMLRVQAGIDSPLGLSDSLYAGAYTNTAQGHADYTRGANLFYSLPYGLWTFNTYASAARSLRRTVFNSGVKLDYDNKTTAAGVKAERVLSRGADHVVYASAGIDYLNVKSRYGGSEIVMQSPKLGVVQAGLGYMRKLASGIWITDVAIERGTGLFGAKDSAFSPFTTRFTNVLANTTLLKNHRAGHWLIRRQHRLSAQRSNNALYGVKQLSIADRYAVRGFDQLTLNGRSGAFLSNTLFARRQLPHRFSIEPYAGADAGAVKDETGWHRAFGAALGMNIAYADTWQLNLESSQGTAYPQGGGKIRQKQMTASLRVRF